MKLESIKPIVVQAGKIALDYFGKVNKEYKKDLSVVTIADQEVGKFLKNKIRELFPLDGFIGEEEGIENIDSEYTWIIDPIDGTVHYANNFPNWSISVALLHKKEIIEGIIYNPVFGDLFYAKKGLGSFKNNQKIDFKQKEVSAQEIFLSTTRMHLKLNLELKLRNIIENSAVIPCYIAENKALGGIVHPKYIWDFAASYLVAMEAGVISEYLSGIPFSPIDLLENKDKDFVIFGSRNFINYAKLNLSKK